MYIPKKFAQADIVQLKELIRAYPLATLITQSENGLEANHLPFILTKANGKEVLQGHIARANPLWKNVPDQAEVLLLFHGPNGYVSPNYYPSKAENGKAVPTWNYVVVHVNGTLSYKHDASWNERMIESLTNQHEAGRANPWSVSDAPSAYTQRMLAAIVGLEIEISAICGKWKLSQNQSEDNKRGVVTGLREEGDFQSHTLATWVADQFDD